MSDAEAARVACGALVAWTNDVADIVNATQTEMQEGADLQALMLDAVDEVIVRTDELGDDLEELDVPDTDGGLAFGEDARSGQAGGRRRPRRVPPGDRGHP